MGIRPEFSDKDLSDMIEKELERVHRLTLRALTYLGEQLLIEARDRPQDISWIDHTGNLRSSIGYVIVYDGKIIKYGGFTSRGLSGTDGSTKSIGKDGKSEGRQLAEELARRYSKGYALIMVAGMNYASYVEAKENKCVLASSELLAREALPKIMERLKEQISRGR
ncbi:MAG: hypothetical protein E7108_01905 [Bacteroidales bacterium]|jgi:hypothetical protein|nr:hypothetical protein [Bacteroidales bacterium]